jgi:hypothetical protein
MGSISIHRTGRSDLVIPAYLSFSECQLNASSVHQCIQGDRILGEADYQAEETQKQGFLFFVKSLAGREGRIQVEFDSDRFSHDVKLQDITWTGFDLSRWKGKTCELKAISYLSHYR